MEPKKAWLRIFDRDELTQIVARLEAAGESFDRQDEATSIKLVGKVLERQLDKARALAANLKIDISDCRLRDARIHDIRRTQGSWQAMQGSCLHLIGKSLGHKNVATTAIYARLQTDPVMESMSKANQAMFKGVDLSILAKPADQIA